MTDAILPPREADATGWLRIGGANIKGTPAMRGAAVEHDLEVLVDAHLSAFVVQEFRWRWYWIKALLVLVKRAPRGRRWASSPGMARGALRPVAGAQAVFWRRDVWRRRATRVRRLHDGAAKISEARWIRAVLLEHKATGLLVWLWTTHNVVGGDNAGDSARRQGILANDLAVIDSFLRMLKATGHPVIGEFDANIRRTSAAYPRLMAIVRRHGLEVVGDHGVEYLLVGDGEDGSEVQVKADSIIPTSRLETDHEVRVATVRIVK